MSLVRRTRSLPVAGWAVSAVAAFFLLLAVQLPHRHLSVDGDDCLVSDEDGSCSGCQVSKGVSAAPPTVEPLVQPFGMAQAALWIRPSDAPRTFRIVRSIIPRAPPLLA